MRRFPLYATLFLVGCGMLSSTEVSSAEAEARDYAARNFPGAEVTNVQCKDLDSDQDGYVRCELTVKQENGNFVNPNIECAYGRACSWAEGCQQPKAMAN